ncbi:MAG TPA: pyridoxal-phosphate dependent enzyme, partial [Gemmatimonadales bacterium]|nr:pyridoxal-phosphate dependent enzyme [Gemmatimonadales bacterium]
FRRGDADTAPWPDPVTAAAGLRVPAPLGGALVLQALRESGGGAVTVSEASIGELTGFIQRQEGIDCGPEGAAAVAGALALQRDGVLGAAARVVVTNTGAGWPYLEH